MSIASASHPAVNDHQLETIDPFEVIGRAASPIAASAAVIAIIAGAVHGFGSDNEAMVGHVHIALGHAIPILTFVLMIGLVVALLARSAPRCTRTQLAASVIAVVGLVLWSAVTAIHSLGFYAVAHVDLAVATRLGKESAPALMGATFAAAVLLVLGGLATSLGSAARRGLVPAVAVGLIVLGTIGSFVAGPVGDAILAVGLGWVAVRLGRSSIEA